MQHCMLLKASATDTDGCPPDMTGTDRCAPRASKETPSTCNYRCRVELHTFKTNIPRYRNVYVYKYVKQYQVNAAPVKKERRIVWCPVLMNGNTL